MNNKLLIVHKALEKFPVDIKNLIIKEVKIKEGIFISNSLRKIYYDKVYLNSCIFSTLCCYSIYFQNIIEDNLILFLIYVKNNLTVSYIMDVFLWMDKFILIHEYYKYKNKIIKYHCELILENIICSRLKNI